MVGAIFEVSFLVAIRNLLVDSFRGHLVVFKSKNEYPVPVENEWDNDAIWKKSLYLASCDGKGNLKEIWAKVKSPKSKEEIDVYKKYCERRDALVSVG